MKPICLIAARKNSKGVPNKNIKSFLGKPLISYAITSSLQSKIFQSVVVSTENDQIAKISKSYGADIPFKRPKSLARDASSMDDVILDTIQKLQSLGYDFDTLVNRDCTAPFIKNSDITSSIKLLKKKNCDAVVATYKSHLNPYFNMMEYKKNGFLEFSKKSKQRISRRQSAPIVFQLTSFQVINVKQFLKNKKIYSSKVLPQIISHENGLMIDTQYEFKIAECLAKNYFKNFL
tara:strand:+ start:7493 stop:8194 length:702 start_codon:yes stop_codon:yes gene_type:complete